MSRYDRDESPDEIRDSGVHGSTESSRTQETSDATLGDARHVAKPTLRLGRAGVQFRKGENIVTVEAKISTSDARGKWDFEPLLDARQAAKLLGGLHVKTVQRMARRGELPGYQIGKFWFFRASELSEWLVLHSSSQNNPPAQTRKEIQ